MAEKRYGVRILDPAQAELEDIARLYRALAGPDAEAIDLSGALVLPGIHDAHLHAADYAHNYRNPTRHSPGPAPR